MARELLCLCFLLSWNGQLVAYEQRTFEDDPNLTNATIQSGTVEHSEVGLKFLYVVKLIVINCSDLAVISMCRKGSPTFISDFLGDNYRRSIDILSQEQSIVHI